MEPSEFALIAERPFASIPASLTKLLGGQDAHSLTETDSQLLCSASLAVRKFFLHPSPHFPLWTPSFCPLKKVEPFYSLFHMKMIIEFPHIWKFPGITLFWSWALSGSPISNLEMPHSRCALATLRLIPRILGHSLWVETAVPNSPSYEVFCHGFLGLFDDAEFHQHVPLPHILTQTRRNAMLSTCYVIAGCEFWVSWPHLSPVGRDKWPIRTSPELS